MNLSLRCSICDYDTSWNTFDCDISLNNILFEFKNMSSTYIYIYIQEILGSERKPMAYIVHFLDFDIYWKYFCLWNFLAVLWIVILACNTFIVVFSDSTLDMSVILSDSPFVWTLH